MAHQDIGSPFPIPVLYAVDYGVVSNNASVNVARNTAALQSAMSAAEGRTLILPPGEIRIAGSTAGACLYAPVGGVTIKGAGRFVTVLKNTTASAFVAAVDADYVDICDVGFDGGQAADLPWHCGVMFRGVVRGSIKNCWFKGIGRNVINCAKLGFGGSDAIPNGTRQCEKIDIAFNLFEDNWGSVAIVTKYVGGINLNISDNIITDSCATGISVESEGAVADVEYADTVTVCRNKISGCSYVYYVASSHISWGISIAEQSRRIICCENIINGVTGDFISAGITINSSSTQSDREVLLISCNDNIITGVSTVSGRAYGILYDTGDAAIKTFTINGNIIDDVEDGIAFTTAAATKTLGTITDLSVIGNTLTNVAEFGIWCLNLGGSGELPVERATIIGNVLTGTGSHSMSLSLINSIISGNIISDSGGIGLLMLAGSADCIIANNYVTGSDGNGIQAEGDRLSFLGNTSQNNGQGGVASYGLYLTSGAGGQILNNRCGDSQGSPTQDYGIRAPVGTVIQGNISQGNVSNPYFAGGQFAAWVVTQNRPATVAVAADNAEHTVLTETVPQNAMAGIGMSLRVSLSYFGTSANNSVIYRLKLGSTTLATVTAGLSAFAREATIVWEIGQNGSGSARCSQLWRETLNGTTTTRDDPSFDVTFDTSGGDQDITVTVQIVNAGDTASISRFAVEHLGW